MICKHHATLLKGPLPWARDWCQISMPYDFRLTSHKHWPSGVEDSPSTPGTVVTMPVKKWASSNFAFHGGLSEPDCCMYMRGLHMIVVNLDQFDNNYSFLGWNRITSSLYELIAQLYSESNDRLSGIARHGDPWASKVSCTGRPVPLPRQVGGWASAAPTMPRRRRLAARHRRRPRAISSFGHSANILINGR